MLTFQQRIDFNYLRTEFYVSARMLFLNDQCWTGCILYGYALESFFKQGLLESGNKKMKLQHSHDLTLLFDECKKKGLFQEVRVPQDFVDYANSLFQMRYPSSSKKETLKAMERNNVMSTTKPYLFCYDELFQQLDEALFEYTKDHYSSSVLKVYAGINERDPQYGLYCNYAALSNYEQYKNRVAQFFIPNRDANRLLASNKADFFWGDAKGFKIYAGLDYYINNPELDKFKFPGTVFRDKDGLITGWQV
jgi:hypothetical protein